MRSPYPFLPAFLFTTALSAQVPMPATTQAGLLELQALAEKYTDPAKLVAESQGKHPTALIDGRCMVGFLSKVATSFDATALPTEHILLGTRKGEILSLRVDVDHLELIPELAGLTYIELAGKAAPNLEKVIRATRADSVHRGIELPQTYTGRDVLIGVTDWGFDYSHPMFYDTAMAEYRVRAAWDHYRTAGPSPADFGYGTELTTPEALLNVGADTVNIYDLATHGTHVAGIAGGGGAGTNFRGMAFDAKFLFCTFLVDAAAVLDAFSWMQGIAEADGKRLVINMSWGLYYIGTLDGNSLISQAIAQFAEEGVVFVNSGGNNGDVNFHMRKDFTGDTLRSRIQVYDYAAHPHMWGQSITMWGEPGAAFSTGLMVTNASNVILDETPWYASDAQEAYLDSSLIIGSDTVYFNLTTDAAHPLNGRPHFRLRVKNTSTTLKVALKATAPSGRVHFWNVTELTNGVGNWGQAFLSSGAGYSAGNKEYGISEPACTEELITVAAYASEYQTPSGNWGGGGVATFSSFGPTMDDRRKPDLAAPGVNVASSMSSITTEDFVSAGNVEFEGVTYRFSRLSGTSMAAPAVAGIAALILEADPLITPAEVRDVLRNTARSDANTGVIPPEGSPRWGHGKVNAYAAVREVLGFTGMRALERQGLLLWPDPADDIVNIHLPWSQGPFRIQVLDVSGRLVHDGRSSTADRHTVDCSAWSAGTYTVRVLQGAAVHVGKVVKY